MDKRNNLHKIILTIYVVMILFLSIKYLNENNCISIIGDEFGYWSAAAFVLNKPWHSLAATNNYYGWGYGLILAPILGAFSEAPILMYRIAILVNAIILCVILTVTYVCTCKLLANKNKVTAAFISGTVTLFPSNIFAVYNTMPEIVLQLLYWLMTWIVLSMNDNKDENQSRVTGMFIVLILIAFYGFGTHQRTIGMLLDVVICCVYYIGSSRKNIALNLSKVFLALLLFLTVILIVKSNYTDWLYSRLSDGAVEEKALTNDFSGMAHNLSGVFSWQGISGIMKSAIGKIYYSFVSTALFIAAGVVYCTTKLFQGKREHTLFYIFIILGWLQAVGIAAIAMPQGFESRTDILIYGRYIEYTFGPLVMLGLVGICEKYVTYKRLFIILIAQAVSAIIVSEYIAAESINTNLGNIFTIAGMFQKSTNRNAVCACSLIAVTIFVIFSLSKKRYIKITRFLLLCGFEIYLVVNNYQSITLPWQQQVNDNVSLNEVYHEMRGAQSNLYVYEGGIGGKMMQFLNPNEECILVDDIDEIEEGKMVVTQSFNKELVENISQNYSVIYRNKILILWQKSL